MKINKKLIIALIIGFLIISMATMVKAATPNEELYSYFKNLSYTVNGKTYTAKSEQLTVLERFLNNKTVTEEQVNLVKQNAQKVIDILKTEKTVDVTKLSKSAFDQVESIVDSTASNLGITEVKYVTATNSVSITYDGRTDSVPLQKENAVQTGHTYVPYIIASVVVLIAIATIVLKRKAR